MPNNGDRMFRVIVLGGIALTAGVAPMTACGGETTSPPPERFPLESAGLSALDASSPEDAHDANASLPDRFPTEGPAMLDAAHDTAVSQADTSTLDAATFDAFPTEGPPPPPNDQ